MGLNKKTERTFVRISDGKLYLSTDKEKTDPNESLGGIIVGFTLKTETFNKEEIEKLNIDIKDPADGKVYTLGLNFDSSYATTGLGFLSNADLSKPVELCPSLKKDGEKEIRTLFVRQNGEAVKSGTSKDSGNPSPMMKKVKISGKVKWDKTDFLEFYRELVAKLNSIVKGQTVQTTDKVELVTVEESSTTVNDGLPF